MLEIIGGFALAALGTCGVGLLARRRCTPSLRPKYAPGDPIWYCHKNDNTVKGAVVDVTDGWYIVTWVGANPLHWRFTFEEAERALRPRNVEDA